MALIPFTHINANSIEEAASALDKYMDKAVVIAGGTDLLGRLKDNIHPEYPEVLINLKTINGLSYIKEDGNVLKIGALTSLHDIEFNKIVKDRYGILAEAARSVAFPEIRNMGTISGNICQEPRCWYYRNPENRFNCIRKGGKNCNAFTGEAQYHSIFGPARVGSTPCRSGCPAGVDIPSYLNEIRSGNLMEAARILITFNPLPAITGRVCPHLCEQNCNRNEFDESVSINSIERFMGDYVLKNADQLFKNPVNNTGKNVAVIGSGPAGLSGAYYLRISGHNVTVYDKMKEPGGMLSYAIPPYRLPKKIVRECVKAFENIGIVFKVGVDVGKDIELEKIKESYDSVFIACGTWSQGMLGIKGEELLISGLEFLKNVMLGKRDVPGKVLVIGGGNVAIDAATVALRLGAKEVTVASLETREEMPAFKAEIEAAAGVGVKLMPSWGPGKILESGGKVTGMELVRCSSVFNKKGKFSPAYDNNVKVTVEAELIILAIGQRANISFLGNKPTLKLERNLIVVDPETQATNISGVFAGGDITSGPASVVESIAAGRRAAGSINLFLTGKSKQIEQKNLKDSDALLKFNHRCLDKTGRAIVPELSIADRKKSIDIEDIGTLDISIVTAETDRCFNCGCMAVSPSDIGPALIALNGKIKTTRRIIEAEDFFTAEVMKSTILDPGELVLEILIPVQKSNSSQVFLKFRTRKSIDFPIINLASVFSIDSGKVSEARIVLGAVAPVPLRMKEAEDYLKGKEISEEVAEAAAAVSVKGAISVSKNWYKVQITKALVKKAILNVR
ncbi:MAG: FAD binding domain-containing protein [Spirochaetes bacterium]|nr:FAD binding domain-containing protein [Spirochaetota bacterium]